jgi:hypothetical protein
VNLIIYTNEHFEEEKALFDLDSKEIVLKGDYYHDKIDFLIEGYLHALKKFEIYNKEVDEVNIDSKHDLYDSLDFYNEDWGEEDE